MDSLDERSFRALPSVDRVLRSHPLKPLLTQYARGPIVELIRQTIDSYRSELLLGVSPPSVDDVAHRVAAFALREWSVAPRPVINATGVILHTNLGRAPLSSQAREAMMNAAGYCDVELDLRTGKRGSRQDTVRNLLLALTGAEACHVTVNNASAVLLVLAALARGQEVIVSRGQAVEIGGGFRIPLVLRQSGARLVEVGTTNRTRTADYEEAISARTAAILHVHTSNFRISGFTESAPLHQLAELAHRHQLILIDDNGSGSLLDTSAYGLAHEPTPLDSLHAGADVVAFSGDKLLGGPQAGILLGGAAALRRVARHPLARATRPDKLVLAALSATLLAYLRGDAERALPIWSMVSQSASQVRNRAARWRDQASQRGIPVALHDDLATLGGGSLPGETLPTTVVVLPGSISAAALRRGQPAVISRTRGQRVLLDFRTVFEDQEAALLSAVEAAIQPVDATKKPMLDSGCK